MTTVFYLQFQTFGFVFFLQIAHDITRLLLRLHRYRFCTGSFLQGRLFSVGDTLASALAQQTSRIGTIVS